MSLQHIGSAINANLAGGSSQGDAPIGAHNFFTQVTSGSAVTLPASPYIGQQYIIRNDVTASINIYPPSGASINSLGANTAYGLPSQKVVCFFAITALQWYAYSASSTPETLIPATFVANAGGGQSGATVITSLYTNISTCTTAEDSCALPLNPIINQPYFIFNSGATTADIYPGNDSKKNSTINGYAVNVPIGLGAGASVQLTAVLNTSGAITWFSSSYQGQPPIFSPSANQTLVLDGRHYNSIISLPSASAGTLNITMPAVKDGITIQFIMSVDNASHTIVITCNPVTGILSGVVACGGADSVVVDDAHGGTISATLSLQSDMWVYTAIGSRWHLSGFQNAAGACSFS